MSNFIHSIRFPGPRVIYTGMDFSMKMYYIGGFSTATYIFDKVYFIHQYDKTNKITREEPYSSPLKRYLKGTPWH